jgi:hypothetical protein
MTAVYPNRGAGADPEYGPVLHGHDHQSHPGSLLVLLLHMAGHVHRPNHAERDLRRLKRQRYRERGRGPVGQVTVRSADASIVGGFSVGLTLARSN